MDSYTKRRNNTKPKGCGDTCLVPLPLLQPCTSLGDSRSRLKFDLGGKGVVLRGHAPPKCFKEANSTCPSRNSAAAAAAAAAAASARDACRVKLLAIDIYTRYCIIYGNFRYACQPPFICSGSAPQVAAHTQYVNKNAPCICHTRLGRFGGGMNIYGRHVPQMKRPS